MTGLHGGLGLDALALVYELACKELGWDPARAAAQAAEYWEAAQGTIAAQA